jgi:DnaK suppressor protein
MTKKFLQQQKAKLEDARRTLREELERFASEDPKVSGDWDTKFPVHDGGTGSSALEDATDEVEEYATRLPIEFSLETRLKDVNLALKKIEKGEYGICENCKKRIPQKRLQASPAARRCIKCEK